MKALAKTIKLLTIFIFSVVLVLAASSFILQDKITALVVSALNKKVTSRVEADKVRLSFLRNFPNGSVELRNVLINSSVQPGAGNGPANDTLLFAESFFLEFRPFDVLRGIYNIKSIDLRDGKVKLFTDSVGRVNYEVTTSKNKTDETDPVNINLEKISLHRLSASYIDMKRALALSGEIKSGKLTSRISDRKADFKSEETVQVNSLKISGYEINDPFTASVRFMMQSDEEGLSFNDCTFRIGEIEFSLEGNADRQNHTAFQIKAVDADISELLKFLPQNTKEKLLKNKAGGILSFACNIESSPSAGTLMNSDFSLNNGVFYMGSEGFIREISGKGQFLTDFRDKQVLDIPDFKMKFGISEVAGSIRINDFINYLTDAHISGTVQASDLRDLLSYENIAMSAGSATFDLSISEKIDPSKLGSKEILLLNPEGTIDLNSFSIGLRESGFEVSDATGSLLLSDEIIAENLRFDYKGQKIILSGKFRNLPEWLAGKPVTFVADGDIRFNKFLPELFMSAEDDNSDSAVRFPGNILLDMNFTADDVTYKNFTATDVTGYFNYKPRILSFKDLNMKSLDGTISGNGFIVQNSGKSIISKGDFSFSGIDVNKAFKTFNNFGQDFIVASNLSGILSGSVSLLLPMDSLFRSSARTITADGNYNLRNGALINFEPVKKLSDFIELSELENIHFQTLENDFYIRNNVLFIPQMDVRSSAADIAVNGRHTFDNTYEYHVRVLLSQILSKKRKTARKPITEFGAVQDDGLGRTSLLLKVESKGDDVRVGYDIKAVSNEVKQGIQKERETLKTILNEEYGWYSEENKQQSQPVNSESRKKFTITWPETDSVPEETVETEEKPRSGLFRKR